MAWGPTACLQPNPGSESVPPLSSAVLDRHLLLLHATWSFWSVQAQLQPHSSKSASQQLQKCIPAACSEGSHWCLGLGPRHPAASRDCSHSDPPTWPQGLPGTQALWDQSQENCPRPAHQDCRGRQG